MFSHTLNLDLVKERGHLRADQIISFPDFLKDAHSILGQPIQAWPHYDLIKCLDHNQPLEDCDYVKRCRSGTLDFRIKMKISTESLRGKYREQIQRMERGETFQIKVCRAYDDQYVITDGHHTVAMMSYFNYPNLQYFDSVNLVFDSFYLWVFSLIKNDPSYRLHNQFLQKTHAFLKPSIRNDSSLDALG